MNRKLKFPQEALIWISGLIILPIIYSLSDNFSFCLIHNLGFSFCPGCGLGRSIIYLFQLELSKSLSAHPLGLPALIIILHRIFTLLNISHLFQKGNFNA